MRTNSGSPFTFSPILSVHRFKIARNNKIPPYFLAKLINRTSQSDTLSSPISKRYGGILLGLAILNRWTLKIGENFSANTDLGNFLLGFVFLGTVCLFFFVGGLVFKNFIRGFYFFKYRKEYREYFNISNEQWYGKFFARFMSKS